MTQWVDDTDETRPNSTKTVFIVSIRVGIFPYFVFPFSVSKTAVMIAPAHLNWKKKEIIRAFDEGLDDRGRIW